MTHCWFSVRVKERNYTDMNSPTNVTAKPVRKLSDAQFCQLVSAAGDLIDQYEAGVGLSKEESFINLEAFRDFMATATDDQLRAVIASEEELSSVFDGSIENFKATINANYAAQEGVLLGAAAILTAKHAIGWVINACRQFAQRNKNTLAFLKPALQQVEIQLKDAAEASFQQSKWTGGQSKLKFRITSPRLPSVDEFARDINGFVNLVNYIKSTNPAQFDANKAGEFLKGTEYYDNSATKAIGETVKGTVKTVGYILPVIHTVTRRITEQDIRMRGWSSKKAFEDGLKLSKNAIAAIETTDKVAQTLSAIKETGDENAVKNAKKIFKVAQFISGEAAQLVRGYVVGFQKLNSSFLSKATSWGSAYDRGNT